MDKEEVEEVGRGQSSWSRVLNFIPGAVFALSFPCNVH